MRVIFLLATLLLLATTTFNDPGWRADWDAQVKFTEAYQLVATKGPGQQSIIMIADQWIDSSHPEFQGRMATGVQGAPFNFTTAPYAEPGFNHGSEMAAISSGGVNNSVGGVSTSLGSPSVLLVSAKISRGGENPDFGAIKAAWGKAGTIPDLTVVNCSFEVFVGDSETEQSLNDLEAHGTFVVIAAGSRAGAGINLDLNPQLVAFKRRHKNLIVVGASTGSNLYSTSNYGKEVVDIVAPGEMEVLSFLGNGSHAATGPSVSTAEVSGALALIRSYQPNPAKAKASLLLAAARNQRNPLIGKVRYGVLDLRGSLEMLDPPTGLTLLAVEGNDARAAAVGSVSHLGEPFALLSPVDFGGDGVARLTFFAINWPSSEVSATAEARVVVNGQIFFLTVEDVREVPTHPWITQVVVKLDKNIPVPGDVGITVSAGATRSNELKIALKQ